METQNYTNAALLRNRYVAMPTGLSAGGKVIWTRTGFSVAVCNAWASLLGIGGEA